MGWYRWVRLEASWVRLEASKQGRLCHHPRYCQPPSPKAGLGLKFCGVLRNYGIHQPRESENLKNRDGPASNML